MDQPRIEARHSRAVVSTSNRTARDLSTRCGCNPAAGPFRGQARQCPENLEPAHAGTLVPDVCRPKMGFSIGHSGWHELETAIDASHFGTPDGNGNVDEVLKRP